MYIAPSSGHKLLNLDLPFKLILRRCEVIFWCLEWECCTFKKIDGNSFKSTNTISGVSKKSWYFWIVCQIKNMKYFRDIFIPMDGWWSHLSYDTRKTENSMLRWALATFVKGMKIRLRKNWLSILAEQEVPSVQIAGGVMNLLLITMDMGCAVYDMVYVTNSLWMSEHALHF